MKFVYNNGIHSISNESYHASEGVSRSQLMDLSRTPAHFYHKHLNPNYVKPATPPAFLLGSMVHTMTLEPHLFNHEYMIKPELAPMPPALRLKDVGRTQFEVNKYERDTIAIANEKLMADFQLMSANKQVITNSTYEQASAMRDAVWSDSTAQELVNSGLVERSIYFEDKATGIQMKARPDIMVGPIGIDLKTTVDGSPRAFSHSASNYGYYEQAAFCHKAMASIGVEMEGFIFVCVEKTEPYCISIHELDAEAIDYGIELVDDLMLKLKDCLNSNAWPSYPLQELSVPGWAK